MATVGITFVIMFLPKGRQLSAMGRDGVYAGMLPILSVIQDPDIFEEKYFAVLTQCLSNQK